MGLPADVPSKLEINDSLFQGLVPFEMANVHSHPRAMKATHYLSRYFIGYVSLVRNALHLQFRVDLNPIGTPA